MHILAHLFLWFALGQAPVPPLNSVGAATSCDNVTILCTYTDPSVPPGPHFYFVVAQDSQGNVSVPSNVVNLTVPAGTHNVVLTWNPSTTPSVTYFIYRGAPATNLTITNSN
jgi:hypothetical protein